MRAHSLGEVRESREGGREGEVEGWGMGSTKEAREEGEVESEKG